MMSADPPDAFLSAASVPPGAHASGSLDEAERLRADHPSVTSSNIYAAAVWGEELAVRDVLSRDATMSTRRGGPRDWDPLTYLCFSRYLRLERHRSATFVRVAAMLLDAGASANTGWYAPSDRPPTYESVIYGAAGIARDPALTQLLLARGADPNDDETPYHAPESYDRGAFVVLLESGRLNADSLATMLLRKTDWHDFEGVWLALAHGAEANRRTRWGGRTALHQALLRDNRLAIVRLLLDSGADPMLDADVGVAAAIAARRGRGDVLELFLRRGVRSQLGAAEALLAACARDDEREVQQVAATDPSAVATIAHDGGAALGAFAGNGNVAGVGRLLDLGVRVDARWREGDGYFGTARDSTALHVAAWRAQHAVVNLLIERGADVNARDGGGRTALMLAVRACVDSYWTERKSPESVEALLRAGASVEGIEQPSGYEAVDRLLRTPPVSAARRSLDPLIPRSLDPLIPDP